MALVRFGFHFASTTYSGVEKGQLFRQIRDVAAAAEESGFDSIWVPDHAMQNRIGGGRTGPMLEAYVLLSALAVTTTRARLGALVSPVTFRNPALLAKVIASLDVVSNGRAILGIGAAWDEEEHRAYGIAFPGAGERESRLVEALQICTAMLSQEETAFSGDYYAIESAYNAPRPIQVRVPILVGGSGERRTLRAVAQFADACNVSGDADVIRHKLHVLEEHCNEFGRDFADITKTGAIFPPESIDELVSAVGLRLDAGLDGLILLAGSAPEPATVAGWGNALRSAFPA